MRTLIVTEFISLDGVIDSPGGEEGYAHAGWTFTTVEQDPTMYDFKLREQLDADLLLLGRTTYEGFAAAWPERDGEFADKINTMPKYVVSRTLGEASWAGTTVIGSVDEVAALREQDGGPILVAGSAQLVHGLYEAGLVDRWHLMVFPVVLGSGRRLWPSSARDLQRVRQVERVEYANGVQLQVLETVR
jgi:dihydrofolate reductase